MNNLFSKINCIFDKYIELQQRAYEFSKSDVYQSFCTVHAK